MAGLFSFKECVIRFSKIIKFFCEDGNELTSLIEVNQEFKSSRSATCTQCYLVGLCMLHLLFIYCFTILLSFMVYLELSQIYLQQRRAAVSSR